jgi:hypothetical protein
MQSSQPCEAPIVSFNHHQTVLQYHLSLGEPALHKQPSPRKTLQLPTPQPLETFRPTTAPETVQNIPKPPNPSHAYRWACTIVNLPPHQRANEFQHLIITGLIQTLPDYLAFSLAAECIKQDYTDGLEALLQTSNKNHTPSSIPTFQTHSGQTLGHLAAALDRIKALRLLHNENPKALTITDYEGNTTAHTATIFEAIKCTTFLLDVEPDLFKRHNYSGLTATTFITTEFFRILKNFQERNQTNPITNTNTLLP